jgi:hypothetical protein
MLFVWGGQPLAPPPNKQNSGRGVNKTLVDLERPPEILTGASILSKFAHGLYLWGWGAVLVPITVFSLLVGGVGVTQNPP